MEVGREKPRKSEPLQAIVQTGEVGFYPLNSLGITALHQNQANCVIGSREDPLAEKLRSLTEFGVSKETIPIKGKIFYGFSDAFYRGKLPELVVVTSEMLQLPLFIEEFMDFMEKLYSLGFMTQNGDEIDLLDKYVPQFVLASYGVVFDVIQQKLSIALDNMGSLSSRQKDRLLQKLSRAVFTSPGPGYDIHLTPPELYDQPIALTLSGFKSMYTIQARKLLENHRITCEFNPNGELGIYESELNLAYNHLIYRVLSQFKHPGCSTKEFTEMMDQLGQRLGLLPGLAVIDGKLSSKNAKIPVSTLDLTIVHQLKVLAQHVDYQDFLGVLDALLLDINETITRSATLK